MRGLTLGIKSLFKNSFFGRTYYKVKGLSLIKLFFDFAYAKHLWEKSLIKGFAKKGTKKIPTLKAKEINQNIFALLLSLNLYMGAYPSMPFIQGALTLYFLFSTKEENFKILIFFLGLLTACFLPFLPFSESIYILYVETGIILFFIVKYADDFTYKKILLYISLMWLFLKGNIYLALAFFPYAVSVLGRGRIKKYIYGTFFLAILFYALSRGGYPALVGGAFSVLAMIVLGELWLIIPSLLTTPWVIGLGVRLIREGLIPQNIVKTGWFFWKYGFRGLGATYGIESLGGGAGEIISVIYGAVFYLFLWYVLRISRRGIVKSFKAKGEKAEILRAGIGAILGLSVYSFLIGGHNLPYIVIVYLVSGGLLKRACP